MYEKDDPLPPAPRRDVARDGVQGRLVAGVDRDLGVVEADGVGVQAHGVVLPCPVGHKKAPAVHLPVRGDGRPSKTDGRERDRSARHRAPEWASTLQS